METMIISIGSAILISVLTYLTKMQKGEGFDVAKFGRTFLLGIILGAVSWQQGIVITQDNFEAIILANAGIITIVDQGWKLVYRLIISRSSTNG